MSRKNLFASGFIISPGADNTYVLTQSDHDGYAQRAMPTRMGFTRLSDLILFLKREAEAHTDAPQFDFRETLRRSATPTPQCVVSET